MKSGGHTGIHLCKNCKKKKKKKVDVSMPPFSLLIKRRSKQNRE